MEAGQCQHTYVRIYRNRAILCPYCRCYLPCSDGKCRRAPLGSEGRYVSKRYDMIKRKMHTRQCNRE
jgi:hypothetical protein